MAYTYRQFAAFKQHSFIKSKQTVSISTKLLSTPDKIKLWIKLTGVVPSEFFSVSEEHTQLLMMLKII